MQKTFLTSIFLIFLIFCNLTGKSQTQFYDNIKKNTIYFELLGNGIFYSLNYDRSFNLTEKVKLSGRIGFHYSDDFIGNSNRLIGSPLEISGLFSNNSMKHYFELGTGMTFMNNLNYTKEHTESLLILAFRIGYRYQKPNGGFFLKTGLVPMNDIYVINPEPGIIHNIWILSGGLGIGYTF